MLAKRVRARNPSQLFNGSLIHQIASGNISERAKAVQHSPSRSRQIPVLADAVKNTPCQIAECLVRVVIPRG